MQRTNGYLLVLWITLQPAFAGVGDPQVATDHPWYPGELAFSTFGRLAATQAKLYEHVVGREPVSDEDIALAAWLWRNTHYWHGEPGAENLWGTGFSNSTDNTTRDYWTGLFAHGFGLCGTTHAQWTAEMEYLLGHNRARVVGVTGHNSFEVFLTSDNYSPGKWVLLDHDVSTVVYDGGGRLRSIAEVIRDRRKLAPTRTPSPQQKGWPVCGLHPGDGAAFDTFRTAEYLAGYAGPPPIVHLRRGEVLRRYFAPGLEDGNTFVYWGRNYNTAGIPGPERSRTWVNQPEKLYGATTDAGYREGQARYANAVYTYTPNFQNGDYREGVIDESNKHITFEFHTPYIIAATPPNDNPWAIYEPGCRNGLKLRGSHPCSVSISTDRGQTWHDAGKLHGEQDLTDYAKGYRQYWLRLGANAAELANADLQITTVCQMNSSMIPQLRDEQTTVRFAASGTAVVCAGPTRPQATAHVIAGKFDSPKVTMALSTPRGEQPVAVHAAAHVASSNPPSPDVTYQIDYSSDQGKSWHPIVRDWHIDRRGVEPPDFWSQSFCWGTATISSDAQPIHVRFSNDGGKQYRRCEIHLQYKLPTQDATKVTFAWRDDKSRLQAHSQVCPADSVTTEWTIQTGRSVQTRWVEYETVTGKYR